MAGHAPDGRRPAPGAQSWWAHAACERRLLELQEDLQDWTQHHGERLCLACVLPSLPPGPLCRGRVATAHLEEDLQQPVKDAHPSPEEQEEGHQQLQEVVAEGLEAVHPPGRPVQEVGQGVGHRLSLQG